jgi:hypothetical protein
MNFVMWENVEVWTIKSESLCKLEEVLEKKTGLLYCEHVNVSVNL